MNTATISVEEYDLLRERSKALDEMPAITISHHMGLVYNYKRSSVYYKNVDEAIKAVIDEKQKELEAITELLETQKREHRNEVFKLNTDRGVIQRELDNVHRIPKWIRNLFY